MPNAVGAATRLTATELAHSPRIAVQQTGLKLPGISGRSPKRIGWRSRLVSRGPSWNAIAQTRYACISPVRLHRAAKRPTLLPCTSQQLALCDGGSSSVPGEYRMLGLSGIGSGGIVERDRAARTMSPWRGAKIRRHTGRGSPKSSLRRVRALLARGTGRLEVWRRSPPASAFLSPGGWQNPG
jgi:hypothetical protein